MALNYEVEMKETNLAIVLLDLIGSTGFVQRHGAKASAAHFQFHDRLARSLIYKFAGREIDRSDGFLCSFDRTIDAVNFALAYQRTVPPKTHLGCRIGIHWGAIVEVTQDDVFVAANAKRIELEGISKNIAARTMSLCGAGQVLLTDDAMNNVRHRTNAYTPKATRYACVGVYQFKGVKSLQQVYAVGETIESLQPPPGNDKVARIGGPKKVRKHARDRAMWDWTKWFTIRLSVVSFLYLLFGIFIPIIFSPGARRLFGLEWFSWLDVLADLFKGVFGL